MMQVCVCHDCQMWARIGPGPELPLMWIDGEWLIWYQAVLDSIGICLEDKRMRTAGEQCAEWRRRQIRWMTTSAEA